MGQTPTRLAASRAIVLSTLSSMASTVTSTATCSSTRPPSSAVVTMTTTETPAPIAPASSQPPSSLSSPASSPPSSARRRCDRRLLLDAITPDESGITLLVFLCAAAAVFVRVVELREALHAVVERRVRAPDYRADHFDWNIDYTVCPFQPRLLDVQITFLDRIPLLLDLSRSILLPDLSASLVALLATAVFVLLVSLVPPFLDHVLSFALVAKFLHALLLFALTTFWRALNLDPDSRTLLSLVCRTVKNSLGGDTLLLLFATVYTLHLTHLRSSVYGLLDASEDPDGVDCCRVAYGAPPPLSETQHLGDVFSTACRLLLVQLAGSLLGFVLAATIDAVFPLVDCELAMFAYAALAFVGLAALAHWKLVLPRARLVAQHLRSDARCRSAAGRPLGGNEKRLLVGNHVEDRWSSGRSARLRATSIGQFRALASLLRSRVSRYLFRHAWPSLRSGRLPMLVALHAALLALAAMTGASLVSPFTLPGQLQDLFALSSRFRAPVPMFAYCLQQLLHLVCWTLGLFAVHAAFACVRFTVCRATLLAFVGTACGFLFRLAVFRLDFPQLSTSSVTALLSVLDSLRYACHLALITLCAFPVDERRTTRGLLVRLTLAGATVHVAQVAVSHFVARSFVWDLVLSQGNFGFAAAETTSPSGAWTARPPEHINSAFFALAALDIASMFLHPVALALRMFLDASPVVVEGSPRGAAIVADDDGDDGDDGGTSSPPLATQFLSTSSSSTRSSVSGGSILSALGLGAFRDHSTNRSNSTSASSDASADSIRGSGRGSGSAIALLTAGRRRQTTALSPISSAATTHAQQIEAVELATVATAARSSICEPAVPDHRSISSPARPLCAGARTASQNKIHQPVVVAAKRKSAFDTFTTNKRDDQRAGRNHRYYASHWATNYDPLGEPHRADHGQHPVDCNSRSVDNDPPHDPHRAYQGSHIVHHLSLQSEPAHLQSEPAHLQSDQGHNDVHSGHLETHQEPSQRRRYHRLEGKHQRQQQRATSSSLLAESSKESSKSSKSTGDNCCTRDIGMVVCHEQGKRDEPHEPRIRLSNLLPPIPGNNLTTSCSSAGEPGPADGTSWQHRRRPTFVQRVLQLGSGGSLNSSDSSRLSSSASSSGGGGGGERTTVRFKCRPDSPYIVIRRSTPSQRSSKVETVLDSEPNAAPCSLSVSVSSVDTLPPPCTLSHSILPCSGSSLGGTSSPSRRVHDPVQKAVRFADTLDAATVQSPPPLPVPPFSTVGNVVATAGSPAAIRVWRTHDDLTDCESDHVDA